MRLHKLQNSIEESRLRPLLFSCVKGRDFATSDIMTTLEAQLSNLSFYGIWIEELDIVLDGPVINPTRNFKIEMILPASETKTWRISEVPFADIVPFGAGIPTGPVTFKLQAKFLLLNGFNQRRLDEPYLQSDN